MPHARLQHPTDEVEATVMVPKIRPPDRSFCASTFSFLRRRQPGRFPILPPPHQNAGYAASVVDDDGVVGLDLAAPLEYGRYHFL